EGESEKRTFFEIEATTVGPDLMRGATRAMDLKREGVQRQEDRAVEEALGDRSDEGEDDPWSRRETAAA
ncbi:MAG: hypothetical protein ACR2KE_01500, partial [Candidatus Nanopelagicales bacterium]